MAVLEHPTAAAEPITEPGWYPDPQSKHHLRYFDGATWTDHVTHHGPSPCPGCGQAGAGTPSS